MKERTHNHKRAFSLEANLGRRSSQGRQITFKKYRVKSQDFDIQGKRREPNVRNKIKEDLEDGRMV